MVSKKKRRRWSKIDDATREKVQQWIRDHKDVSPSPNKNDTLLVKDPISGVSSRKPKLILYIPVRDVEN